MRTLPLVGTKAPARVRIRVVLPAPFGPTSAVTPGEKVKETPSRAIDLRKDFRRSEIWTLGRHALSVRFTGCSTW